MPATDSACALREKEQLRRGSLRIVRRFENVHPDDQTILKAIAVANAGVRDELTGVCVVDHPVDVDRDAPVGLLSKALRLDVARDRRELPARVVANRLPADHATALPGVGPI